MGYNNYNDADGALNLVKEFDEPAAAVIKHTNPAGCATSDTVADAYDRALRTDAKSAFGGIVALNRECDADTADAIVDSFKEVVVAPATPTARSMCSGRRRTSACSMSAPSVRVMSASPNGSRRSRSSAGGWFKNGTASRRPPATSTWSPSASPPTNS